MRQGQQNRRGRGRGRKVQNPLSRNYESNGPDVKIRGTASHIAEKYSAMARDAIASGDNVAAENYYQHAEHYNRIIMAAQTQSAPQSHADNANGSGQKPRRANDQANAPKTDEVVANADTAAPADGAAAGNSDRAPASRNGAAKNGKDVAAANGGDADHDGPSNTEDGPPDSAIA